MYTSGGNLSMFLKQEVGSRIQILTAQTIFINVDCSGAVASERNASTKRQGSLTNSCCCLNDKHERSVDWHRVGICNEQHFALNASWVMMSDCCMTKSGLLMAPVLLAVYYRSYPQRRISTSTQKTLGSSTHSSLPHTQTYL